MGCLITLGILILLAVLPLGIVICYDAAGATGMAVLGPIRIKLFPKSPKERKKDSKEGKKKEKPVSARKKSAAKEAPSGKTGEATSKKGGSVTDFLPLVDVALALLNDFRRKLRVNLLEVKVILAGDDPCDLAMNYGKIWAAVGNLMPRLERVLTIQKRDIEIECDFTAASTVVIARVQLTITLGRLLALVAVHGFRGLTEFLKIKKKRKGGAAS